MNEIKNMKEINDIKEIKKILQLHLPEANIDEDTDIVTFELANDLKIGRNTYKKGAVMCVDFVHTKSIFQLQKAKRKQKWIIK